MPWLATISQTLTRIEHESAPSGLPIMDEPSFAAFHARTAAPLLAYLTRAAGNRALAEDLSQEAYLRFLRHCRPEKGEVACRRFLFRIATNLLHDHWRRPATAATDAIDADEIPAPLSGTGASDAEIALAPAWVKLRPRERQILWLAYVEGYNHREMAEIVGLRTASLRMMLFRARHRLRSALTGMKP